MQLQLQNLLLLLVLMLVLKLQRCISIGNVAVPPLKSIQPLYVCKMQVSDMPSFTGQPTPEMFAANIGLSESLAGMMQYWNIDESNSNYQSNQADPMQTMDKQDDSSSDAPITVLSSPSPSPAPPSNPGFIVPRSKSDSQVTVGAVNTAIAAEAAIANRHLMAATLNSETEAKGKPAAEYTLSAVPSVDDLGGVGALDLSSVHRVQTMPAQGLQTTIGSPSPTDFSRFEIKTMAASMPSPDQQILQHPQLQEPPQERHQPTQHADASSLRSLLQSGDQPATTVCNKASPTDSAASLSSTWSAGTSPGSPKFGVGGVGFSGIAMAKTQVIPPDPAIAVGPDMAMQIVNSLVAIYRVSSGSGNPQQGASTIPVKQIPLPDFFSLVASPCSGGYFSPAATYDKHVGRFIATAVCGGDAYQVLLAVSTTPSALESWILYSFAGEVTQGTPMGCDGFPTSLHTQVTYNKDGVYLSFVQNCPNNQIQATGGVLYALPKWAVYKGATYFWVPVFTAWEVQRAAGLQGSESYPPSAFLQLQPVLPQRPADVQAEVAYFVNDNSVYDARDTLQRTTFTLSALMNTGSLWLYEGPGTASPTPLLVSKIIPRGVDCMAVYGTKLLQPDDCGPLNAGGVRPPGFWDGGAVLFSDKIYLADRGPDLLDANSNYQPTIYWAMLQPSFCVSGPCAPWFGADWGWSSGWDWTTGTWAANSDRGRNAYADPGYYNQQFVHLSQNRGRRLHADDSSGSSSSEHSQTEAYKAALSAAAGQPVPGQPPSVERNELGVVKGTTASVTVTAAVGGNGGHIQIAAAAEANLLGPVTSRQQLRAVVTAQQAQISALQAAQAAADLTLDESKAAHQTSDRAEVSDLRLQYKKTAKYAGEEIAGPRVMFRQPRNASTHNNTTIAKTACNSSSRSSDNKVQASALLLLGAASFIWNGFLGWGIGYNSYYYDYYQYYSQYFLNRAYSLSQPITARVNPCKYYKYWPADTSVTFGAIVQNRGVLEFATGSKMHPLGLAFPQVAVRGGQMLLVYSYSGASRLPDGSGTKAYPGVAYSTIPITNDRANSYNMNVNTVTANATFHLVMPGGGCISQLGSAYWGAYSGIDTHFPSYRVWTAVEYAASAPSNSVVSNAAIWISTL